MFTQKQVAKSFGFLPVFPAESQEVGNIVHMFIFEFARVCNERNILKIPSKKFANCIQIIIVK